MEPFQTPNIGIDHMVANFQLSQHFVYKSALFLIIKQEQCQNHSSEIKEKLPRPIYFIFETSVL